MFLGNVAIVKANPNWGIAARVRRNRKELGVESYNRTWASQGPWALTQRRYQKILGTSWKQGSPTRAWAESPFCIQELSLEESERIALGLRWANFHADSAHRSQMPAAAL